MGRRTGVVALAALVVALYLVFRGNVTRPPGVPPETEAADKAIAPALDAPGPPEAPPEAPPSSVVLQGRVVDAGGDPVQRAWVQYKRSTKARTGSDGSFVLSDLKPGTGALRVKHRKHLPHRQEVEVPASDVLIRLLPGLDVSGKVTTPKGVPLEGVWVHAGDHRARSNAEGLYRISGLSPGEVVIRCLGHPGIIAQGDGLPFGRGPEKSRRVQAGDSGIDFTVSARTLDLRVWDEKGLPLAGAQLTVAMTAADGRVQRVLKGTLDERGRAFTVVGRTSKLLITVLPTGRSPLTREVQPHPDQMLVSLEYRLPAQESPGALVIRVRSDIEEKIPALFVTLTSSIGAPLPDFDHVALEIDSSGRGRLEEVPPGSYEVAFSTSPAARSEEGFGLIVRSRLQVVSGVTESMDVAIPAGGRLRVSMRTSDGALAAPGFVALIDSTGKKLPISFGFRQGEWISTNGLRKRPVLSLAPIPPGRYELVVHRGRKTEKSISVTVHRNIVEEVEVWLDD